MRGATKDRPLPGEGAVHEHSTSAWRRRDRNTRDGSKLVGYCGLASSNLVRPTGRFSIGVPHPSRAGNRKQDPGGSMTLGYWEWPIVANPSARVS